MATPDSTWTPDCLAGHVEARTSELAFKLRTKPIGLQHDPVIGPYPLGVCVYCKSTISLPPEGMRGEGQRE